EDFSLVILDEFHERSLSGDLILGFLKEIQHLRDDLRIIIMSATIDPTPLQDYFQGEVSTLNIEGRNYPVSLHYEVKVDNRPLLDRIQKTLNHALTSIESEQNILVFLTGAAIIEEACQRLFLPGYTNIPLYGSLSMAEQQRAFLRGPNIIFATNIAETSLTLPNIGAVIDCGLEKVAFEQDGFLRLQTRPISQESADQRAGRAGRTQKGHCYRLWRPETKRKRSRTAQVQYADLSSASLSLYVWGITPDAFPWPTPPPSYAIEKSISLLQRLGAIQNNTPTDIGKRMARLPLHPRIARFLIQADSDGVLHFAAALATLLSNGESIQNWTKSCTQFQYRRAKPHEQKQYWQLIQLFPKQLPKMDKERVLRALITGFPDRIGQKRPRRNAYLLSDGSEAMYHSDEPWLIAPTLTQSETRARRIRNGFPISPEWLTTTKTTIHTFQNGKVQALEQIKIGAIVLQEQNTSVDMEAAHAILLAKARATPHQALNIDRKAKHLLQRMDFVRRQAEMPTLDNLLFDICYGKKSFAELQKKPLKEEILQLLSWEAKTQLEKLAPTHFTCPSGARVPIDYSDGETPLISARIQQLFGLERQPIIAGKRAIISLLAPNNRPQQRTQNIETFWKESYIHIRKELRGRYPKHAWPEHPTRHDAQNHPIRKRKNP
ncbi:MAG: ATP-dependent helicase C-terminal domain-containing protein, partial [Myxococcota bacterium]|nr:ATP-dependent helicase C-terminal domain-containing protein [Myxococcota bacterium]